MSSSKAQPLWEGAGQARSCSSRWTYQTLNPNKPKPQLCADCTGKVIFQQLDISNAASVIRFAAWAKREFPQGIDILVNNAGMAYKGDTFGAAEAQATLDTNFYGTSPVALLLPFPVANGFSLSRNGALSCTPAQQCLTAIVTSTWVRGGIALQPDLLARDVAPLA